MRVPGSVAPWLNVSVDGLVAPQERIPPIGRPGKGIGVQSDAVTNGASAVNWFVAGTNTSMPFASSVIVSSLRYCQTRLGLLLIQDLNVRVVNAVTGELLRDLQIDPNRDYQGRNQDHKKNS